MSMCSIIHRTRSMTPVSTFVTNNLKGTDTVRIFRLGHIDSACRRRRHSDLPDGSKYERSACGSESASQQSLIFCPGAGDPDSAHCTQPTAPVAPPPDEDQGQVWRFWSNTIRSKVNWRSWCGTVCRCCSMVFLESKWSERMRNMPFRARRSLPRRIGAGGERIKLSGDSIIAAEKFAALAPHKSERHRRRARSHSCWLRNDLTRLGEMISPTVYSQEKKRARTETGENFTTTRQRFTLPAQESVTVTFR